MLIRSLDGSPPSPATAREGAAVSGTVTSALPKSAAPTVPVPVATEAAPTTGPLSPKAVQAAVERANAALRQITSSIEFHVDPTTHRTIVKLVDKSDGHVLRQVPSEEMLEIARALEHMQARLVQGTA